MDSRVHSSFHTNTKKTRKKYEIFTQLYFQNNSNAKSRIANKNMTVVL